MEVLSKTDSPLPLNPPLLAETLPPLANAPQQHSVKARLEVRKFDGRVQGWQEFWDAFQSSFDKNNSLSAVDKFSYLRSNRSKTSASFSSGVPNTEKQMKARRRRRSAFIVSRCLEPLMKNEARVFELASQTSMRIFSKNR